MKAPTEKQENCRYSFLYQGENMDQVYCKLKNDKETHYVTQNNAKIVSSSNIGISSILLQLTELRLSQLKVEELV